MPLTHLDENHQPGMVDVSHKTDTARSATASARVELGPAVLAELRRGDFATRKGSIVQTAVLAGTQAVKQTWSVIPLCHAIPVSGCRFTITEAPGDALRVECTVRTVAPTGVEMEALHGASVAALTIYDMTKALSHDIRITALQLEAKSGGRRDFSRGDG